MCRHYSIDLHKGYILGRRLFYYKDLIGYGKLVRNYYTQSTSSKETAKKRIQKIHIVVNKYYKKRSPHADTVSSPWGCVFISAGCTDKAI